jgi:hypothetical protein
MKVFHESWDVDIMPVESNLPVTAVISLSSGSIFLQAVMHFTCCTNIFPSPCHEVVSVTVYILNP